MPDWTALSYTVWGHLERPVTPRVVFCKNFIIFFSFIFISWRLITLQYCSDFCHTLTWSSHGFTCVPHPDPLSCLLLHPIPLGLPSAPALSTCLMLPTWVVVCFTLDSILVSMLFFQNIPPSPSPTESQSLFCTSGSLFLFFCKNFRQDQLMAGHRVCWCKPPPSLRLSFLTCE